MAIMEAAISSALCRIPTSSRCENKVWHEVWGGGGRGEGRESMAGMEAAISSALKHSNTVQV